MPRPSGAAPRPRRPPRPGGSGPPGHACRVPGALESDEQARGSHTGLQIEQRARSDRRGVVIIDAAASGDPEALATDLRVLGAENVTVFGRMVSGRLPITAIRALQDRSSLQFAGPAYATTNVEDVTSQRDRAMGADIARATFGIDRPGVMGRLS